MRDAYGATRVLPRLAPERYTHPTAVEKQHTHTHTVLLASLRLRVVGTTTRSQSHNTKTPLVHHDVETFLCPLGLGRLCFFRSIGLCVTRWCPKGSWQGCCQGQDCQAQKVRVFLVRSRSTYVVPSCCVVHQHGPLLLLDLLSTLACQLDKRLVSIHGNMLPL